MATPISDHAHPKIFWSTFNLCEFVSKCKKSGYFIDLFRRYGWLKNTAIWLAENIFADISWDLSRNATNNIHFHCRSNTVKINNQINKLKKPCFWSIFPILGAKNFFLENLALSRTTSHGILAQCQNLENINDTILRKCPDRWKDGRMDRRMEGWMEGRTDPIL